MLISFFLYISIFIFAALGIHLITVQPKKSIMDSVLMAFLSIVLVQVIHAAIFRDLLEGYKYVDRGAPFGLVYGPLLFFGYRASFGKSLQRKEILVHLLPLIIATGVYVFFLISRAFREEYAHIYYITLFSVIGISWVLYPIFLAFKRPASVSAATGIYRYAMIILVTLASFLLPLLIGRLNTNAPPSAPISNTVVFIGMLAAVVIVYFYLLEQMRIVPVTKEMPQVIEERLVEEKLQASTLREIPTPYFEKIKNYLSKERYLNPDFKLDNMSKDLGIPKNIISQYFNQVYKDGFVRTVNSWRIAYACQLLLKEDVEFNIEDLAFKCGFSSRASFYRNFNQEKACTPLEYREQYLSVKV
ncbi:AraC family transcriptional regulator [Sphingobacterium psychroaquaticum]|uniref:AraC-type DNA-binding protein n=2 Tax=Sphingobacterium psychroaquaticum TaxID=561061 RepID=A0A1X7L1Q1_9SPHI|nr:AraC family transcriptional regulator [Sphingobacterium psychroaquaticum]SMG47778.1 AraC-type DNA-binding protein [Sphingobacterium psychroaquaticum]